MANDLAEFDTLEILGSSGLRRSGGDVTEDILHRLHGRRGAAFYREMADNSSVIGAIRFLVRMLARQVEWRVEPADDSPEAQAWADFVEGAQEDMSNTFEDYISEALTMVDYGWAYMETTYKLRKGLTDDPTTRSRFNDGKFGWRKIALRGQETLEHWEFDDEDGSIKGMWQQDEYATVRRSARVFIPIEKAILFRTESTKNNPEGRSLYRNAALDWFLLKRIQEIEAIGIERDLTGILTILCPPEVLASTASTEMKQLRASLEKMASQVKRDERDFILFPATTDRNGKPTGWDVKLLTTPGTRQIDTNKTKDYYRTSILQSVLAQFLQLGQSAVGSFALADSQTNLFAVAMGTILDTLATTHTRFGIHRLMKLNSVPRDLWPKMVHGDLETPSLAEVGKYITSLTTAGVDLTSDVVQRKLLEFAKLPTEAIDDNAQRDATLETEDQP